MFKRIIKGEYGYIKKKQRQVVIRTLLYFLISLSLYFIGIKTTGTRKNLLTVVAVLGLLPASKSLVNMIMFLRAKGCSEAFYKKISELNLKIVSMYDMYFTSYEKNFAVSHMIVYDNVVLGITEDEKTDVNGCAEHIKTMLKNAGHKGMSVTVVKDKDKYLKMLENIAQNNENSEDNGDDIRISLYEITL